jgi:hypothetical protein
LSAWPTLLQEHDVRLERLQQQQHTLGERTVVAVPRDQAKSGHGWREYQTRQHPSCLGWGSIRQLRRQERRPEVMNNMGVSAELFRELRRANVPEDAALTAAQVMADRERELLAKERDIAELRASLRADLASARRSNILWTVSMMSVLTAVFSAIVLLAR